MRLTETAQAQVERFLRAHWRVEELRLPRIFIHAGRPARLLTRALHVGAITFGRHVFIAPSWLAYGAADVPLVPGWLVVHEATHTVQYRRAGVLRFLCAYLSDYGRGLVRGRQLTWAKHQAAYAAIAHEVEAFAAEAAYRRWAERVDWLALLPD